MYTGSILVLALSAATMVSAHGKVLSVVGNAGGNGTALGIKGASIATFGPNSATEKDTTVFGGNANDPTTNGLGKTTASGTLKVADLADTMAASGSTLPQVSADGTGTITGTWRIVTSDGTANNKNGDLFAVIDSTGTGAYSTGTQLTATSDMVGNGQGNVVQRTVTRALRALGKRATNVGADAPFTVKIPAGTTCTGTDATSGATNFCLMKIANNNNAGPFGGSIAFQVAGASTSSNTTAAATTATQANAKAAKAGKTARREQMFKA
ncbi:uncharacterized protein LY89DRAFT_96380 [Mollisia scopiformis]|uniref:GEgh 16 protein n=1 Tax=Mollisia scopiformis TaxID=149040 RepID=A0A194X6T7_MOLSC|nr:uncharacterized protein LY89DRAFT_96380 [Mollisia scopiformis]KUJ15794.1 hypothetical protein LY89DRAFT_96380 [Mollisia scopiformis]